MEKDKNLLELEDILRNKKQPKLLDKIFGSNKIEFILKKIQNLRNILITKLKFTSKDKIGKLIIIFLVIVLLIITSVTSVILLTPLLGIRLILLFVRYFILLVYKIIKSNSYEIIKYLRHKFPQSEILKEKKEFITNNSFSDIIFKEVEKLISKMDSLNLSQEENKEIALRLKQIVLLVEKEDGTVKQELYSLNIKQDIINMLNDVEYLLQKYEERDKDEFYINKNNLIEILDEIREEPPKIYKKII